MDKKIIFIFFLSISTSSAIFLECNFQIDSFPALGSVYFCNVNRIFESSSGYNGSHVGNRNTQDVGGIRFPSDVCGSSNLIEIPSGLKTIFPNLIALGFFNCPITNLSGYELENYPNLRIFEFSFTDLERIPGNFFNYTSNISHITFADNKIQRAGRNLLNHLQRLSRLDFQRNSCIDMRGQNDREITALIQALDNECEDVDQETTTQLQSTSVAGPPSVPTASSTTPKSDECDLDDVEFEVCTLIEQVATMQTELDDLSIENKNLRSSVGSLKEEVDGLRRQNEILQSTVDDFGERLNEQEKILKEMESLIIEWTSRPCAC